MVYNYLLFNMFLALYFTQFWGPQQLYFITFQSPQKLSIKNSELVGGDTEMEWNQDSKTDLI